MTLYSAAHWGVYEVAAEPASAPLRLTPCVST